MSRFNKPLFSHSGPAHTGRIAARMGGENKRIQRDEPSVTYADAHAQRGNLME